jgi:hypothetical protein
MSKQKTPDWDTEEHAHEPAPTQDTKQLVRIRCITDARPFTGTKALALENGEEADVPADVAKLLVERKHVEYVK